MNKKVGFIGAGYMGFGIAKNILKNDFSLKVIAHKNRVPIEKLLKLGASEAKTYDELLFKKEESTTIGSDSHVNRTNNIKTNNNCIAISDLWFIFIELYFPY